MGAVISLLVVLSVSLLITRIASVALQHTGLSKESAKFQARSAFTGVGFTTTEAEAVTRHPVRRRIVALLMLLGNVGVVTAISSLVLTFINPDQDRAGWWREMLMLVGGVAVLWTLASSQWVEVRLARIIDRALRRWTGLDVRDYAQLLDLRGDYQLIEMSIPKDSWLAHRKLKELELRQEGVEVLGINREDGRYLGVPRGDTALQPGDSLVLYGRQDALKQLDSRRADAGGEAEHRRAVDQQRQVQASEQAEEHAAQGETPQEPRRPNQD